MQLVLTPEQAAIHDRGSEPEIQALMESVLAQARRLSARNGHINVYFDYETVEVRHPDGTLLGAVEADPWAEEQRELARRIFAVADAEDVVLREAVVEIVRAEYGEAHPEWHKTQHGTTLAEAMGCWQAYASLCEARPFDPAVTQVD